MIRLLARTTRFTIRATWMLFRVAVVVAVVAFLVATRGFDYVPLAVQSGSMEPAIPTHSLVFVEEVPAEDVAVGDVITFQTPVSGRRVTHRVVDRHRQAGKWYFETKGDANPSADDWRRESGLTDETTTVNGVTTKKTYTKGVTYGKHPAVRHVWSVPHLGHLIELTDMKTARTIVMYGSLVLLGLILLLRIWRPAEREDGAPTVPADEEFAHVIGRTPARPHLVPGLITEIGDRPSDGDDERSTRAA